MKLQSGLALKTAPASGPIYASRGAAASRKRRL